MKKLFLFMLCIAGLFSCDPDCVQLEGDTRRCYTCEWLVVNSNHVYDNPGFPPDVAICDDYDAWNDYTHFVIPDSTHRYIIRGDTTLPSVWLYLLCKQPFGQH